MIKAEVGNGKATVELDGRTTQILVELTLLVNTIFEQLEEASNMPADFYKTAFIIGVQTL